ncbi:MAG: YeeE/YedE family protein [Fulvivirga sp.]
MKFVKFLFVGVVFGITLTKAEIISWYRIYEMFRFQSFHTYGVIGSAVVLGVIVIWFAKKTSLKGMNGDFISMPAKEKGWVRYLVGGTLFGLGWALTGACPGPIYILIGNGFTIFLVVLLSAVIGTFTYGLVRDKLPH